MKYTTTQLKNTFSNMDFTFLDHKILKKLLFLLNGRMVGGVVRDSLLGIPTNDLDIATVYKPNVVFQILTDNGFRPVGTGIEYGTISLFFSDYKVEITSLRKDVKNFGRKATVEFGGTWEEDSLRRDFTFNGLFLSVEKDDIYIYDYHQGLKDLENGEVRFIGNYKDRIQEDYLRILRFIRFFIRYSKREDYSEDLNNFLPLVPPMKLLSVERVLMELESILKTDKWSLGIEMINNFQISELFFQTKLLNTVNLKFSRNENYIIYVLSPVNSSIIQDLPMKKNIRNNILWYQWLLQDFSIENLYKIWNKTKNLSEFNELLFFYKQVNNPMLNITLCTDEEFEAFHKSIPIRHATGIERGLEEKNIKLLFIKQYVLNLIG